MDESRRQFEEWIVNSGLSEFVNMGRCLNGDDEYIAWDMQLAFKAWQASRQAIEIETPPRINEIHLRQPKEVEDMWLHRLKFAVESAGLKIKGET